MLVYTFFWVLPALQGFCRKKDTFSVILMVKSPALFRVIGRKKNTNLK